MRLKLSLALLFFIIATLSVIKAQTIPNGDFENWSEDTLYEKPLDYYTSNDQSLMSGGTPGVTKTTDSYSGNYAVSLTTVTQNGNTIPAILSVGNIDNPGQGVPYNEKPDSISMYVKENMNQGDTAAAFVLFSSMSNTIGMAEFSFYDSATSYQAYKKEINWFVPGVTPDSAALIISTGNFTGNGISGSNIIVDSISFGAGYSDLPNNNFENWKPISDESPDSWKTSNVFEATGSTVVKTNDSYSGNYAAKITSKSSYFGEPIGFLTNGRFGDSIPTGGYHVWNNPDVLSGYYKYNPDGSDTAIAFVVSYAQNQSNDLILVDSNMVKLPQANNYTLFEVPLDYNDWPIVDTVNIFFSSGNIINQNSNAGVGSELYVDDLSMSYKPTSVEESKDRPLIIAPNPARKKVQVNLVHHKFDELKRILL